jgi:hypothetical protein
MKTIDELVRVDDQVSRNLPREDRWGSSGMAQNIGSVPQRP